MRLAIQNQSTAVVSMGGLVGGGGSSSSSASTTTQTTTAKTTTTVTSTTSSSSTIVRPTATTVGGRPSIANTTNIDTLLNAKEKSGSVEQHAKPNDKIQDKVAFIFNNLSLMNMSQKAEDLKEVLGEEYTKWLAQYLVMKRASIEPNFHTLYSSFLETLGKSMLFKEVLKETYGNIDILLKSDKGIANFSDRSLLKNLGHWLGLITLARNVPILIIDLDIKPLITEAYQNGQQELLYVVPFVAKVLESCAKSKVFKPPCPWTMGIMNLLAELHQEHDLKLNLKFEIEVLCKNLSIELTELQPGTLLKENDKLNKMLNFNNFGMKPPPTQPGGGMVGIPGVHGGVGGMPPGVGSAKAAMDAFPPTSAPHLVGRKALEGPPPPPPQQQPPGGAQPPPNNTVNANLAASALGIDISGEVRMPTAAGPGAAAVSASSLPMSVAAAAVSSMPPGTATGGPFSNMHFGGSGAAAATSSAASLAAPPQHQPHQQQQQQPGAAGAGMGIALLGGQGAQGGGMMTSGGGLFPASQPAGALGEPQQSQQQTLSMSEMGQGQIQPGEAFIM